MKYYTEYKGHQFELIGKRNKYDSTIYTFDIETSSFIILNGQVHKSIEYKDLSDEEQKEAIYHSNMYIWQLGINDDVYYGRTWAELIDFMNKINEVSSGQKFMFIHNLSFEFQYLKSYFNIENVKARKSRKVMSCDLVDYKFTLKCTYYMTNVALKKLPDLYNLPVEKLVGDLDYDLLRHSKTILTEQELKYCENDCLVVFYYIKFELERYKTLKNIPNTATGHVRKELKELTIKDNKYRTKVRHAINTDPHIYNMLVEAFQGGYTHANFTYADMIIKDVDSWDFTSSYPYCMVSNKYPSSEFKRCYIKRKEEMNPKFAYLMKVRFTNVKTKYYNTFISMSKCKNIEGGKYDNGRILKADSFETTITDIDFNIILSAYNCEYEIIECYFSFYDYLPIQFINFILSKYIIKTQYKGIESKKLEYNLEKAKFNSLYGMSVTKNICDKVMFDNITKIWEEVPLSNKEIEDKLIKEKKTAFLSFSYGVWITAYARNNLIQNVMKLDDYAVYMDTDSIKLCSGYDKNIIENYNKQVEEKIKAVSNELKIDINKFAPEDVKGHKHMLGLFDDDGHYEEFITQGAKKYAVKQNGEIKITVSGVPKCGAKALHDLSEFKDNFVFKYEDTGKELVSYCENQEKVKLIDYNGIEYDVDDISGICVVPTTYELGKAFEYASLIDDFVSKRSIYKEGD